MELRNEVVVGAPLEQTWTALLDVPRVGRALPGASIDPDGADGSYRGRLKVRLGPVTVEYEGVATLVDVDEDEHVASFHLQGREARGHGGATATITNHLFREDGATRVVVETDLAVTGRAAQLGRGLMEDVAARMLEQFASRLEREVLATAEAPEAVSEARPAEEALDLGAAAWRPLVRRYAWPLAFGAAALIAVAALRRRAPVVVVIVERR
jgi:carbon monoxide dehydrogenase subunit G